MKCIEGCESDACTKGSQCPRVVAMADFIDKALKNPPHTTTLPEVVGAGGVTPDQWRAGYTKDATPCFKRAVEARLGGRIVYEASGNAGKDAVGVRRLTFLPRDP